MNDTKSCNICFITKNRPEFYKDKTSIRSDCIQCNNKQKLIREGKHTPTKRNKVETIIIKVNDIEEGTIKVKKCNRCFIIIFI